MKAPILTSTAKSIANMQLYCHVLSLSYIHEASPLLTDIHDTEVYSVFCWRRKIVINNPAVTWGQQGPTCKMNWWNSATSTVAVIRHFWLDLRPLQEIDTITDTAHMKKKLCDYYSATGIQWTKLLLMTDYYTKRSMSQTTHTVNPVFVGDRINTDIHKECRECEVLWYSVHVWRLHENFPSSFRELVRRGCRKILRARGIDDSKKTRKLMDMNPQRLQQCIQAYTGSSQMGVHSLKRESENRVPFPSKDTSVIIFCCQRKK